MALNPERQNRLQPPRWHAEAGFYSVKIAQIYSYIVRALAPVI
jgi:hypothetical protein